VVRTLRIDHPSGSYQWRVQLVGLVSDPTGNTIGFQIIPLKDSPDDTTLSTWTSGAWAVAYDAARRTAWASTPMIGAGGLTVSAGKSYRLLARPDFGGGLTPIHDVALIEVAGSTDRVGR